MPIDTSIYGQIRPFRMQDPYESASHALAFKDASRKYRMEGEIQDIGRQTGGDPEKMSQALLTAGHYGPAAQLRTQAEQQKKAKVERDLKLYEATGSDAMVLDQIYRQTLQQTGGNKEAAVAAMQPHQQRMRQKWLAQGMDIGDRFDPDMNFSYIGQAKEAIQYLKSLAPDIKYQDTGGVLQPVNLNAQAPGGVGPVNAPTLAKTPAPSAPTELARYQDERARIAAQNPNDPRLPEYDRVISGFKAGRGTDVTIQQPGPMVPGKAGANKIDEGLLDQTQGLMRLDAIQSQFRPEYQTLTTRGANWWSSVKEKAGVGLTNKETKDLEEFSKFKRTSIDSLNQYIKSVTGAAMSEAEAQRILRGMPNPGQGVFDGDSPTEFKAKLDDAIVQTKRAIARSAYLKRNGMSLEDGLGKGITLDRMPQMINDRGREIETELKKTGVTGKPLERAVRRQLGVEFGLVSD